MIHVPASSAQRIPSLVGATLACRLCTYNGRHKDIRQCTTRPRLTSPRSPSPSTRHARRAKRWQGRGVAPGSAGSLGHALHPLAMRSPGGAALGVRADPRRGHQAAGGHGGCARGR